MRRLVAPLVALCVVIPALPARVTHADDTAAEQAAREIAAARERANDAADALFRAQTELEELQSEQAALENEIAQLRARISDLQSQVQQVAINRYTRTSGAGTPLLTGFDTPGEQMQVQALTEVIADTSDEQFDDFDALNRDLDYKQTVLERQRQRTEAQRQRMSDLRDQANAEVEHLKKVEAQRLKDEAVRKALAAEQKRQLAAAEKAAVQATTSKTASGAAASGGTTGGGGGSVSSVQRNWTGVDWLCPTGSANTGFSDTWLAPRPGGRVHQGTDMIAALGTPLLAVVDGVAKPRVNDLGGNTVSLLGADGNSYYYAHLSSWGKVGKVTKGTVIGYVGMTGNASTYHLHFEIHPGNGDAVNPYLTLLAHCPAPPE